MINTLYLTCIHDRHTDDKFKVFVDEKEAKNYLLTLNWPGVEPSEQYFGDCVCTFQMSIICLFRR